MALSPNGKTLALGGSSEGKVWFFDTATLKKTGVLNAPAKVHATSIHRLAFSPDGKHLAGTYKDDSSDRSPSRAVRLWDLFGSEGGQSGSPGHQLSKCRFSPDGNTMVVFDGDGELALWDVASGRGLHRRPGYGRYLKMLATSPDGKVVASGDGSARILLWNAANGELLHSLTGADDSISACLIASAGKRMITVGSKGTFQFWGLASKKGLSPFPDAS